MIQNARIKHYPGFDHITVFNYEAFTSKDTISRNIKPNPDILSDQVDGVASSDTDDTGEESSSGMRSDSVHRARMKVFDIAYLNHFDYFVTLTFNGALHSRTDAETILHTVRNFTRNLRKYDRTFSYLLLPEYHADGEAIHLHGLFTFSPRLALTASGHFLGGRPCFNVSAWSHGFSTAITLDDNRIAVAKYITKYVTKDVKKIFGNIYLAGNVNRNVPEERTYINFTAFDGVKYDIRDGLAVKYKEVYFDQG